MTDRRLEAAMGHVRALEDAHQGVLTAYLAAHEAEVARMLPLWPSGVGEPRIAWGPGGVLLGLCEYGPIGEIAVIHVAARPIVLTTSKWNHHGRRPHGPEVQISIDSPDTPAR